MRFPNPFKKKSIRWEITLTPYDLRGMVGKYQGMNPETEDLLMDGTELRVGMIVLVESFMRAGLTEMDDENYEWARRANRWCTVATVPQIERVRYKTTDDTVVFMGVYEDGTKARRSYMKSTAWLVKKSSIPQPDELDVMREDEPVQKYGNPGWPSAAEKRYRAEQGIPDNGDRNGRPPMPKKTRRKSQQDLSTDQ
jgi:hypothetical protein